MLYLIHKCKLLCRFIISTNLSNYRTEFDKQNLSQHYKYLIFSTQLTSIERLIISDTRLMIDWKIFQLMSPDDFPYLKYLELPNNCFYDFNSSPNTPIQEFPNLHLKFFISVDNNQEFYNGLKSRFYNRFAPQETKWEETNCKLIWKWKLIFNRTIANKVRQAPTGCPSSWRNLQQFICFV